MKKGLLGIALFVAGTLAIGALALAQSETTTPATPAATKTEPTPTAPTTTAAPVTLPPASANRDFKLAALASDTFVMVKDQGDYQTVIVYKVTPMGKVQQTDRRNFFYAAP